EFEADEFAIKLMKAAKYDPKGAIEFFNKLIKLSKDGSILPEYFSTHPPVESRISKVKTLI
ncbi:M48 family metalloprotease, partial [Bacteroidota bacterium]